MNLLTRVKVMKTIWPYDPGYGVVIVKPFGDDTVTDHGLSKEEAEQRAAEVRRTLRGK